MDNNNDRFKVFLKYSVVIGTFLVMVFYMGFLIFWTWRDNGWFFQILQSHFAATIGLPLAAVASLVIVILLEFTSGPIKMKAIGFEFEGAAAPAILWMFCFLTMVFGIKLLW